MIHSTFSHFLLVMSGGKPQPGHWNPGGAGEGKQPLGELGDGSSSEHLPRLAQPSAVPGEAAGRAGAEFKGGKRKRKKKKKGGGKKIKKHCSDLLALQDY